MTAPVTRSIKRLKTVSGSIPWVTRVRSGYIPRPVSPSHRPLLLAVTLALCACARRPPAAAPQEGPSSSPGVLKWGLVLHGGAGTTPRGELGPEKEQALRAALKAALETGHAVLARGGSSTEAVTAALVLLEDNPLFNAGKGAVYTHDGGHELDAAVMDGAARKAGAVAGVRRVKNPVLLARLVMERSPHVLLTGSGAEAFAAQQGVTLVEPSYFDTEERWKGLQRALEQERRAGADGGTALLQRPVDGKFGTVGAVALDLQGHLAAATSTGGMTNKRFGRVGDSPIIGAGTYADDSCAVSATGHGEYFIRYAVAHDVCARARYQGAALDEAARAVVLGTLVEAGGEGGLIALDRGGRFTLPFNTTGMYRGWVAEDGATHVALFRGEP